MRTTQTGRQVEAGGCLFRQEVMLIVLKSLPYPFTQNDTGFVTVTQALGIF